MASEGEAMDKTSGSDVMMVELPGTEKMGLQESSSASQAPGTKHFVHNYSISHRIYISHGYIFHNFQ